MSSDEAINWFSSFGFQSVVSPGSNHSCGVVILYRPIFTLLNSSTDSDGRFALAELSLHDRVFRVVCLYAPNRNPSRDAFFSFCQSQIDLSMPTVVCGDFNTVLDRSLDRRGSCVADASRESSSVVSALLEDCCVVDIWRYLHPSDIRFTWDKPDGSISSRIDLVGCPISWVPFVSLCDILVCPYSDHSAVFLKWTIPESMQRGPGRWKLNVSLLSDDIFVDLVTRFWNGWRCRKRRFASLTEWWDAGKSKIKGLAIRFSSEKSKQRNMERDLLTRLLDHLKAKIDIGGTSFLDVYLSVQSRLSKLDAAAARGAQIRSRVKWAEEGETSSSYFYRLEKKRSIENWFAAIEDDNGNIVTSLDDICESWVSFYSSLFEACPVDLTTQDSLLDEISHTIPSDFEPVCEGLLSPEEVLIALNGMASNKSPGTDGLPAEFYCKFWNILGQDLVDVFNFSYSTGLLSESQRIGLISLTFKKGSRLERKNWRPISLLNVDYKLCTRSIAGRLLKVLHFVVAPDQTCGVPGRFIGENVSFLRDVSTLAAELNLPLAILSLDQEKAFDRVDWVFLLKTISVMGFGPSFLKWIKLFYSDIKSAVLYNGYCSPSFILSRGVRQGCPLSPLLYILTMEVLAVNIRNNPVIKGLSLPGIPTSLPVLSLYADDTSVVVSTDASIVAVFDTYDTFEQGTGSKLNLSKCEGLWLGAWRNRVDCPVAIRWTSDKVKILGIYIGFGDLHECNWRSRIDAVDNCLASWRHRSLSYQGKALVINSLALSRIWYVASLVHMPVWVLKELNSLTFKFFWNGKKDLVARRSVTQPTDYGGFKVVNILLKVSALLLQWVRRWFSAHGAWVSLLTYWCFDRFGTDPLSVLTDPHAFVLSRLPPFYRVFFKAWRLAGGGFLQNLNGFAIGTGSDHVSPVASTTCKSVYDFLLSRDYVPPHCIAKFQPVFGDLYWASTWRQLSSLPLDRKTTDFGWKVAHGVPYTAERLISFGYDIPSSCFCGHQMESLDHLLFSCPLAQSGISWIQSLLFQASPVCPSIGLRHVRFGFSPDELLCVPRIFVYLLNACKYLVWCQRNDLRFRNAHPSAIGLISTLKTRVRFYLPLYFKRFRSHRRQRWFNRQWGGNGVICTVRDSKLILHI